MYIVGPSLLLTLLLNALRNSVACSIVGAVVAPAVFLAAAVRALRLPPGPRLGGRDLSIVQAGLIGLAAARQARKTLDSFARLQLLRRYLPPAAVERVMRDDPDVALSLGGRLATVTLLAADLRGFTAMSEKLPPVEVMAQLNAYHGVMIDVIDQHGGAIDKFIGDGTLVVFGLAGSAEAAASAPAVALRPRRCPGRALAAQRGARPRGDDAAPDGDRRAHGAGDRRQPRRPRAEAGVHGHRRRGQHGVAPGGSDQDERHAGDHLRGDSRPLAGHEGPAGARLR